jgi:hypothetical protein
MLVCDPCSAFYMNNGAFAYGITVALPLVRFTENRDSVRAALSTAFEGRFADADCPQVFLAVLLQAVNKRPRTPRPYPTPSPAEFDLPATMAAANAANTFRDAVEWTARDLLHSVVVIRELSEVFSPPSTPGPLWPLSTTLAGLFEELDASGWCEGDRNPGVVSSLLRYPLQGFVVILKASALLNISTESRRRATFRRLLYLVCEGLDAVADQVPHSQSIAELFRGLLGRPPSTGPEAIGGVAPGRQPETWHPATSISIQALLSSSLTSNPDYCMLSQTEEFRDLEDPLQGSWVGPSIALFLHGLFRTTETQVRMDASAMFQTVVGMELIGNALLRPETIQPEDVLDILSAMAM